jgi:hypothetical protein
VDGDPATDGTARGDSDALENDACDDDELGTVREFASAVARFGSNPRNIHLVWLFHSMRDGVVHLRRYVDVVMAAQERYDAEPPQVVADRTLAGRSLDEDTRRRIRAEVDAVIRAQDRAVRQLVEAQMAEITSAAMPDVATVAADPVGVLGAFLQNAAAVATIPAHLTRIVSHSWDEQVYWITYLQAHARFPSRDLVLRSQFIVASSLVQPALATLLLALRQREEDRAPNPVGRATIDKEIKGWLGRGPGAWKMALVRRYGLGELEDAVDWEELERFWRRRNLFVHRGGIVDATYKEAEPDAPHIGMPLELSIDDVYGAFDFVGGVRLGFLVAVSALSESGFERSFAGAHSYLAMEDLDAGRWWLAEGIARAARAFTDSPATREIAQVNLWLARLGRLGRDAIAAEVRQWQPSTELPTLALAKVVLLGDATASLAAIHRLLNDGELSAHDLRTWPLFAEIRESGALEPFFK